MRKINYLDNGGLCVFACIYVGRRIDDTPPRFSEMGMEACFFTLAFSSPGEDAVVVERDGMGWYGVPSMEWGNAKSKNPWDRLRCIRSVESWIRNPLRVSWSILTPILSQFLNLQTWQQQRCKQEN
jgi:hypothetical protein